MVVYGEEAVDLNIFNGISPSKYHRKVDYNIEMKNLIKTGPRELTIRDDFLIIWQNIASKTNNTSISFGGNAPRNIAQESLWVFPCGDTGVAVAPSMIYSYSYPTGSINVLCWNTYGTSTTVKSPGQVTQNYGTAGRVVKAFCQYKDRYYASNRTDHIFRISNFDNTGVGTITITDLAAVGVNHLLSFKNRLFGFTNNRIYWTDLPSPGGYPETWNTSVNFTDLPSTSGEATIYSVKIFKDKIYIFTDRAIYYFVVNGDPVNWNLQVLTDTFRVFHESAVCYSRGLLYLTDNNAIYSFDGTRFIRISDPIKELFYNYEGQYYSVTIGAWDNGIAAYVNQYNTDGSGYWTVAAAPTQRDNFYYWDGEIWVKLTPTNSSDGNSDPTNGFYYFFNNQQPMRGFPPCSIMVYGVAAEGWQSVLMDSGKWLGDIFDNYTWASGTRRTKSWALVSPPVFRDFRKFVKVKYFNLYARLAGTVGQFVGSVTTEVTDPVAPSDPALIATSDMGSFSRVYRIPVTSTDQSKFSPHTVAFGAFGGLSDSSDDVLGNQPPLIITGVQAIVNTDNSQVTDLGNA